MAFISIPDSPEFLVAFMVSTLEEDEVDQILAFCRSTDKSWTLIETYETETNVFGDIAVHDGKIYAATIDVTNFVFVFSPLGDDASAITAKQLVMLDPKPIQILGNFEVKEDGILHRTNREVSMLAMDSTSGELLLVLCQRDGAVKSDSDMMKWYSNITRGFRVYKLDQSGPRWYEIKHLGDRFLFVDYLTVRVVYARGLDGVKEFNGGNWKSIFSGHGPFVSSNAHDVGLGDFQNVRPCPIQSQIFGSPRSLVVMS